MFDFQPVTVEQSRSPLRQALDTAIASANGSKLSMKDLTVLAPQNDPFRVDTPAGHRDGEWLAVHARELGLGDRTIHLRGLHYMVIGRPKPDGTAVHQHRRGLAVAVRQGAARPHAGSATSRSSRSSTSATPTPVVRIFEQPEPVRRTSPSASTSRSRRRRHRARRSASTASAAPSRTSWCWSARSHRSRTCSPRSPTATRPTCTCRPARSSDTLHLPDGQDRRRGRPADGRPVLLRLRPGRLADADLGRPQAAGVQGARCSPTSSSRCTGSRSSPTRSGSTACHQPR